MKYKCHLLAGNLCQSQRRFPFASNKDITAKPTTRVFKQSRTQCLCDIPPLEPNPPSIKCQYHTHPNHTRTLQNKTKIHRSYHYLTPSLTYRPPPSNPIINIIIQSSMCHQNYTTYTTCTHTYPSYKTPCKEANLPTKYRQHCKPFLTPRVSASGLGKVDAVDVKWSKFRIPDERRQDKEGICPDCAVRLAGEMGGRLFRRREEDEISQREREREDNEREKEKGREEGWIG